jgi:hypothetical protein
LDNFLIWSFVKTKIPALPKVYRDAQLEFEKVYFFRNLNNQILFFCLFKFILSLKVRAGTSSVPPRSKLCANAVIEVMPFAVGRLYVKNNFDEASKKDVTIKIISS